MKKRFSEEQIVKMIQEHKQGKSVSEISREYGVAEQTFYKWQQKYGDMKVSEVKKMKSLEDENARLKRLVAELSLEKMKAIIAKHPRAGCNSITMSVSKVAPRIVPALSMQGEDVAEVLDEIWHEEKFKFLQTDNGPEFRSSAVQTWCIDHDVKQVFSRPGKPTDNCFIESFNRIFRDECLNENYFSSLSEAKQIIESWRIDYNENRPQKGLKELTPNQFKSKLKGMKNSP